MYISAEPPFYSQATKRGDFSSFVMGQNDQLLKRKCRKVDGETQLICHSRHPYVIYIIILTD